MEHSHLKGNGTCFRVENGNELQTKNVSVSVTKLVSVSILSFNLWRSTTLGITLSLRHFALLLLVDVVVVFVSAPPANDAALVLLWIPWHQRR
jgi:hypothetical protein